MCNWIDKGEKIMELAKEFSNKPFITKNIEEYEKKRENIDLEQDIDDKLAEINERLDQNVKNIAYSLERRHIETQELLVQVKDLLEEFVKKYVGRY